MTRYARSDSDSPSGGQIPSRYGLPTSGLAPDRPPLSRRLAVFLICAGSFFHVEVIGQLYVVEIALAAVAVLTWLSHRQRVHEHDYQIAIGLLLVWLLSAVTTDLYRGTSLTLALRGFALVFFTLCNLAGLRVLTSGSRGLLNSAVLGLATAGVLSFFIQPSTYAHDVPWKFGFAYPTTLFAAWLASSVWARRSPTRSVVVMSAIGGLNLILGARSLGAICLLVAAIALRGRRPANSKRRQVFVPLLLVAGLSIGGAFAYGAMASSGALGQAAQTKYLEQAQGSAGIVIGGRPETVVGMIALTDSPVIGHGSVPTATQDLRSRADSMLTAMGYRLQLAALWRMDTIPVHSGLLQAWVWHGLGGVAFWIWILVFASRYLVNTFRAESSVDCLVLYLSILTVWDVLFSPFGGDRRLAVPLVILFLCSSAVKTPQRSVKKGL